MTRSLRVTVKQPWGTGSASRTPEEAGSLTASPAKAPLSAEWGLRRSTLGEPSGAATGGA